MKAKKLLAILLSVVMLFGIVPMTAFGAAPANPFFDDFEGDFEQFWGTVGNKDLVGSTGVFDVHLAEENGNKYLETWHQQGNGDRGSMKEFDYIDSKSLQLSFDFRPGDVPNVRNVGALRFYSANTNSIMFQFVFGNKGQLGFVAGPYGSIRNLNDLVVDGNPATTKITNTGLPTKTWYKVVLDFDFVNHKMSVSLTPRDVEGATATVFSDIAIGANHANFNRMVFWGGRNSGNPVTVYEDLDNFKISYEPYAANNILSIEQPANYVQASIDPIDLPTEVTALMGDGSSKAIKVGQWTSEPAFDPAVFQTYTYTAPLVLEGTENPRNLVASFKMDYHKYHYVESVQEMITIQVDYPQTEAPALPATVPVKLSNGKWIQADISGWTSQNPFDASKEGVYIYTASIVARDPIEGSDAVPYELTKNLTATQRVSYADLGTNYNGYERAMEWLDRGVVALKSDDGIFVSWRLLASEYGKDIAFNLYRNGEKINAQPITTVTNFVDAAGKPGDKYAVETILSGISSMSAETAAWEKNYMAIPLQYPGDHPDIAGKVIATYSANDAGVADVDGDGEYEIVVKWYPSNQFDSGTSGVLSSPTFFDCYKLDGTLLWRLNMGYNVSSGAHYSQFLFYDFDMDGKAEFLIKGADGTRTYAPNAEGKIDMNDESTIIDVVGDPSLEGTNVILSGSGTGHIGGGNEYMIAIDGLTGEVIDYCDYAFPVGNVRSWGDTSYNRSDRYNCAFGFIPDIASSEEGAVRPTAFMNRGYYARTTVVAYQLVDDMLQEVWTFDSDVWGDSTGGRGNHNNAAGDLDADGYDEVLLGSIAIDHDGSVLWVKNGKNGMDSVAHGDTIHLAAMIPGSSRLQVFSPYEDSRSIVNYALSDAGNGARLLGHKIGNFDAGRGVAANITPNPGFEIWSQRPGNETPGQVPAGSIYNVYGDVIAEEKCVNFSCNWRAYWDGDLLSEMPDGQNIGAPDGYTAQTIYKYNWETNDMDVLDVFEGTLTNNGTKNTPNLAADILGDWREEIVTRAADSSELRIYTTAIPTDYMIYTLMHDPVYRNAVANQNGCYNQPPHLGFYLGEDVKDQVLAMELPTYPMYYSNTPVTAETDALSYKPNSEITVTVTTGKNVDFVYLANELGNGLVSTHEEPVLNEDNTLTWTLKLSLGTVGTRTLKVFADYEDTGATVSFAIANETVAPPAEEAPEAISVNGKATVKANQTFEVTIKTNQAVSFVRLFNESGMGLAPASLDYVDNADGTRTWTYATSVGSIGTRTLNVRVAGADRVYEATDVNYTVRITR